MLNVLDLFAGIGGFSLGLKQAGPFRTVCYVENNLYCQAVLKARIQEGSLDDAPVWDDITAFNGKPWRGKVDLITGGFPCQDISAAGRGKGLKGSRSGLWAHMWRIIREVEPPFVLVENAPLLRRRGLDKMLSDFYTSRHDAEWDGLSARAVGAPQKARDRIWILAYPQSLSKWPGLCSGEAAQERRGRPRHRRSSAPPWPAEPNVGRVAYGVPARVDRLRALGNAVVPQVVQQIGKRITRLLIEEISA